MDILGCAQQRATMEIISLLEHLSYQKRVRELALFILEKAPGDLNNADKWE